MNWRKLEEELVVALEAAGLEIVRESGDAYSVVAAVPGCSRPVNCGAGVGPYGKLECADCENEASLNSTLGTIEITKLARRLELIIGGKL